MSAALSMPAMPAVSFRAPVLPWAGSAEDELRFKRLAQRVLISCALFAVALPWLPIMKIDRAQPQELPPPLVVVLSAMSISRKSQTRGKKPAGNRERPPAGTP